MYYVYGASGPSLLIESTELYDTCTCIHTILHKCKYVLCLSQLLILVVSAVNSAVFSVKELMKCIALVTLGAAFSQRMSPLYRYMYVTLSEVECHSKIIIFSHKAT